MSNVAPILTLEDLENIFNPPSLTLQEIEELRQDFSSAKEWRSYVELNIPNADPQEQYEIKLEENRKRNRENCGNVFKCQWCPVTLKFVAKQAHCKQPDCLKCKTRKKQQFASRLEELSIDNSVITLEPEQVKSFQASLSKNDYIRIPRSDGKVSFILNEAHEGSEPFTFDLKEELLLAATDELPNKKRVTGNLGKTLSNMPQKNDEVTDVLEEPENILADAFNVDIKAKSHEIIFTPESTLTNTNQIETETLKRLDTAILKYNISMLQWLIDELEKITKQVCEDNGVIYKVLYIETISANPDEIEWDKFRNRLEKAKF